MDLNQTKFEFYLKIIGILTVIILILDLASFFQISAPFLNFSILLAIKKFLLPNFPWYCIWIVVSILAFLKYRQVVFFIVGLSPFIFYHAYDQFISIFLNYTMAFWLVNLSGLLQLILVFLNLIVVLIYLKFRYKDKSTS